MSGWYDAHTVLINQTLVFAILAMSTQLVLRASVFSFANVGCFGVGEYVAANLAKHDISVWLIIPISFVGGWVLGELLALCFRRLRGLYLGMVTFALVQILVVVALNGKSLTGGALGLYGYDTSMTITELIIVVVIVIVLVALLERQAIGRSIAALRTDERLAQSLGVNTIGWRDAIAALSAGVGAVAGASSALVVGAVAPTDFGFDLVVTALTMAVVGGIQCWWGACIGAFVVTWFPQVSQTIGGYKQIVYGLLVVLILLFEPDGIAGILRRCYRGLCRLVRPGASQLPTVVADIPDAGTADTPAAAAAAATNSTVTETQLSARNTGGAP